MRPTYGGALQAEGRLRGWSPARLLRSGCHRLSSRILTAVCAPRHCAVSVLAHAPGICVATCFSHAGACLHFLHGSLEIQTLILMTSTFCHVLLLCFVGFGVLLRNLCLLQGHTYFLDISRSSIVLPFMFIFRWGVTRG